SLQGLVPLSGILRSTINRHNASCLKGQSAESRPDLMNSPKATAGLMTSEEFAALVGLPPSEIVSWRSHGLLDPEGVGGFDELDLLRWMAVRHYLVQDYSPEQLGEAVRTGAIRPFLADHLYPLRPRLDLDEVAKQSGVPAER